MAPGYEAALVVVAGVVVVGVPGAVVPGVAALLEDDAVPGRHCE